MFIEQSLLAEHSLYFSVMQIKQDILVEIVFVFFFVVASRDWIQTTSSPKMLIYRLSSYFKLGYIWFSPRFYKPLSYNSCQTTMVVVLNPLTLWVLEERSKIIFAQFNLYPASLLIVASKQVVQNLLHGRPIRRRCWSTDDSQFEDTAHFIQITRFLNLLIQGIGYGFAFFNVTQCPICQGCLFVSLTSFSSCGQLEEDSTETEHINLLIHSPCVSILCNSD